MSETRTVDPVLVYDGDCGFCTSSAQFAERYLRASLSSANWEAVPFQFADLAGLDALAGGRGLVTRERAEREILWVTPVGDVYGGAQAAARLLMRSGGAWAYLGAVLTLAPVRPLAAALYRWVADHRHSLPGGTPACALPRRPR
ncbi:thiol-disulfide oxidoreductase DCC family protein [Kitasatospora sp. NPDC051853]|uniref:thiol-disulfide oxidoreductase DCC family protein n=1 Tax=Kitasatospora sp. NPDC051853 TaxID=3364058 RepID=UPI0037B96C2D